MDYGGIPVNQIQDPTIRAMIPKITKTV